MRMHPVVVAGVGLILALLIGSWVYDYFAATAEVVEATIVGKRYTPGHYEQQCSTNDRGRQKCEQVWETPSWLVSYSDGWGSHDVSVTSDTYDQFKLGDRQWVSFQQGGYWKVRYSEKFLSRPPDAERTK
jgi:hypothetical protein